MSKTLFLTATAAVMLLAASCGQTAKEQNDNSQQQTGMNDQTFSELLLDIIYKLPASVMPDFLKTEEQRTEVVTKYVGNADYINPTVFSHWSEANEYYTRYEWMMAGYLTEDSQNIVLIVQYGSYLDGYLLISDKTLNYDIETQTLTEIERPMELPTVDEMIVESNFDNQRLYNRAKAYFDKKMELNYRDFDKEGFRVSPNSFKFWLQNDDYNYYEAPFMIAFYKWDGNRFYKDKIINSKDL